MSSLYSALARDAELTSELLLEELYFDRTLSTVMVERISQLCEWVQQRNVVMA